MKLRDIVWQLTAWPRRRIASIMRWSRCRGFGVQSPFAFRFVNEVVADHGDDDDEVSSGTGRPSASRRERLRNRFYVRLRRMAGFTVTTTTCRESATWEAMLSRLDEHDILVVEGIREAPLAYDIWRQLLRDRRTGVAFDLYDLGVVFFDLKQWKHCYKVMLHRRFKVN